MHTVRASGISRADHIFLEKAGDVEERSMNNVSVLIWANASQVRLEFLTLIYQLRLPGLRRSLIVSL